MLPRSPEPSGSWNVRRRSTRRRSSMDGMKEFPAEEGSVHVVCPGDSDYSGDGGGDDGSSKHRHTHCSRVATHVCAQRRRCLGEINNNAVWNIENGNAAFSPWTMPGMKRKKQTRRRSARVCHVATRKRNVIYYNSTPSFQYFPFLRIQPTPWVSSLHTLPSYDTRLTMGIMNARPHHQQFAYTGHRWHLT